MHKRCLIQDQMNGESISVDGDFTISFALKSKSGRTVMTFSEELEEKARKQAEERSLNLFRITTITERI